jgi:hypothetical protein
MNSLEKTQKSVTFCVACEGCEVPSRNLNFVNFRRNFIIIIIIIIIIMALQTHNADTHALSGIRTHDPSVPAKEDSSCLRPRGHCDRQMQIF